MVKAIRRGFGNCQKIRRLCGVVSRREVDECCSAAGGSVTIPVIDMNRVKVKGDGLERAAVNCPSTFRLSTKATGDARLDVTVTGDWVTHRQYVHRSFNLPTRL